MNREQKAVVVGELIETFNNAQSLIVASFGGLKVADTLGLRSELRQASCHYRVIKNSLAKRAVRQTKMASIEKLFVGPTAIAYSFSDPVAPAKLIDGFDSKLPLLEIRGGFLDGTILDPDGVTRLAKMKGKDELRAELLALMLAPAQELLRLFQAAPAQSLRLLEARKRALSDT